LLPCACAIGQLTIALSSRHGNRKPCVRVPIQSEQRGEVSGAELITIRRNIYVLDSMLATLYCFRDPNRAVRRPKHPAQQLSPKVMSVKSPPGDSGCLIAVSAEYRAMSWWYPLPHHAEQRFTAPLTTAHEGDSTGSPCQRFSLQL